VPSGLNVTDVTAGGWSPSTDKSAHRVVLVCKGEEPVEDPHCRRSSSSSSSRSRIRSRSHYEAALQLLLNLFCPTHVCSRSHKTLNLMHSQKR
jgi:hypothetical protein